MEPSIAKNFERGKFYQVQFIRKPQRLSDSGSYVVADYDISGALITHTTGGQILMEFVPWTNIVSIDLTS